MGGVGGRDADGGGGGWFAFDFRVRLDRDDLQHLEAVENVVMCDVGEGERGGGSANVLVVGAGGGTSSPR